MNRYQVTGWNEFRYFTRNGTQFCAVSAAVPFCCDTAGTRLVVARINDLQPAKLKLDVYALD